MSEALKKLTDAQELGATLIASMREIVKVEISHHSPNVELADQVFDLEEQVVLQAKELQEKIDDAVSDVDSKLDDIVGEALTDDYIRDIATEAGECGGRDAIYEADMVNSDTVAEAIQAMCDQGVSEEVMRGLNHADPEDLEALLYKALVSMRDSGVIDDIFPLIRRIPLAPLTRRVRLSGWLRAARSRVWRFLNPRRRMG